MIEEVKKIKIDGIIQDIINTVKTHPDRTELISIMVTEKVEEICQLFEPKPKKGRIDSPHSISELKPDESECQIRYVGIVPRHCGKCGKDYTPIIHRDECPHTKKTIEPDGGRLLTEADSPYQTRKYPKVYAEGAKAQRDLTASIKEAECQQKLDDQLMMLAIQLEERGRWQGDELITYINKGEYLYWKREGV